MCTIFPISLEANIVELIKNMTLPYLKYLCYLKYCLLFPITLSPRSPLPPCGHPPALQYLDRIGQLFFGVPPKQSPSYGGLLGELI